MKEFIERNKGLKIIEEANAYFEKYDLNEEFELFFNSEKVKKAIQNAFALYLSKINVLVNSLPDSVGKKSKKLIEHEKMQEDALSGCTRDSLRCNISAAIQVIEDFSEDHEAIKNIFLNSFSEKSDGKMFKELELIISTLTDKMLMTFHKKIFVSNEFLKEIDSIRSDTEGEFQMSFTQFIEMLGDIEKAILDEDDDESDEESDN